MERLDPEGAVLFCGHRQRPSGRAGVDPSGCPSGLGRGDDPKGYVWFVGKSEARGGEIPAWRSRVDEFEPVCKGGLRPFFPETGASAGAANSASTGYSEWEIASRLANGSMLWSDVVKSDKLSAESRERSFGFKEEDFPPLGTGRTGGIGRGGGAGSSSSVGSENAVRASAYPNICRSRYVCQ